MPRTGPNPDRVPEPPLSVGGPRRLGRPHLVGGLIVLAALVAAAALIVMLSPPFLRPGAALRTSEHKGGSGMSGSNGRVAGKVAIVTGAASGLGKRTAEMLAAEGARVVATDINLHGVQEVAHAIGDAAIAIGHDVTDEMGWQAVIAETVDTFGGLHVLVNNAGIGTPGTVEETTLETWRQVHAIDLDSVFLGCKYACRPMADSVRDSGLSGSIVNISSVAGIIAAANLAAYNSAKAAVRHLTKSVALHCARQGYGIRCNSVHPAFVDTPILDQVGGKYTTEEIKQKMARQLPLGQIGEPSDVGYAVLYLASDESKFMTGAEIVIDGGVSAM